MGVYHIPRYRLPPPARLVGWGHVGETARMQQAQPELGPEGGEFSHRYAVLLFAVNCLPSNVCRQLFAVNWSPSTVCPQLTMLARASLSTAAASS